MKQYKPLITPLISLVILTIGSALLTTFLSVRLHTLGVNAVLIGGLSSAYYGGMVLGAFKLEKIIFRVGHIRSYSAFASILAVVTILHGFYVEAYFWLLLRFLAGVAMAGLYIVIESWILSETSSKTRGASLALYMIAIYIAQSAGQWLLGIGHENTLLLYCIGSVLASLSVIPLSLTRVGMPVFAEPDILSVKKMFSISPTGVMTCFVSGLVLGSVYGLYPVFIQHSGYSLQHLSTIMGLMILGGMLFQYPLGRLSDIVSRRYVIAFLCFFSAMICCLFLVFIRLDMVAFSALSFILGGSIFCLYPIGISHSCDRVTGNQIVSATQTLLLAYGVGATIGPVLAPLFNTLSSGSGVLIFIMVVCVPLGVFALWRKQVVAPVPTEEKQDFTLSVEMTPVATEIDPKI